MSFEQQRDAGARLGPHRADVLSEDQTFACDGFEITVQDVDGRRLARTVFTQKPEDPPVRNLEAQVFVDQSLAVPVGQIATFDDRIRHDLSDEFAQNRVAFRHPLVVFLAVALVDQSSDGAAYLVVFEEFFGRRIVRDVVDEQRGFHLSRFGGVFGGDVERVDVGRG